MITKFIIKNKLMLICLFALIGIKNVNAQWAELGGANTLNANGIIRAMVKDAANNIYVAGDFKNASGKYYVAKFNGSTWSELGGTNALNANGYITTLVVDPTGNVYAAGNFTNANGKYYVAKFNGSIWSELGGASSQPFINAVTTITADNNSNIYAADLSNKLAKFNGSSWSNIDITSLPSQVTQFSNSFIIQSLVCDNVNNLYIGCDFSVDLFGFGNVFSNASGVWKYNGNNFTLLGDSKSLSDKSFSGLDCFMSNMYVDNANRLYVTGTYVSQDLSQYIARWNGSTWEYMTPDLNNINSWETKVFTGSFDVPINSLSFNLSNSLFYCGGGLVYATINNTRTRVVANCSTTFNGQYSSFTGIPNDTSLAANGNIRCLITDSYGNVYAAGEFTNGSGKYYVAKYTTPTACTPTTGTFTVSACGSYTWAAKGNKVYTASNNTDTIKLTNVAGCDSIVTLNLTITNCPPPGNALNFDGVNDYVSLTNNPVNGLTSFTIESWFLLKNTNNWQRIFDFGSNTNTYMFFSPTSGISSLPRFAITTNGFNAEQRLTGNSVLATGKWHHFAITYNQATSTATMYINGIQVAQNTSVTITPSSLGAITNNWIGRSQWSPDPYFNGSMDEFRIWNTARTQSQIQANMYNVVANNSAGLLAYYKFDQGIAGANNAGITSLADFTSTINNGTLQNFTLNGNTSNWVGSYAMIIPTATAATNITNSGFTANWTAPAIGTVDNYLLDISTNASFSSFVSGYNGLSVVGTSQIVTGLSAGATYYYRVRANKTSVANQGNYSNTINTTTLTCSNSSSTTNLSICSTALPYSWNGLTFNAAGSQTAHLTNASGCDSAATLNLSLKTNYSITASAGSNGSISNSGVSTICEGSNSATYTITPNSGYSISSVLVDGVNQGAITTYTFNNVTANHTITAIFISNCIPTTSTSTASVCSAQLPYVWNGNSYNITGSYTVHLTNSGGCDSAATLNLTVINNPSTGQLYSKYGYATSVVACTLDSFRVYPDVKGGVWSSADSSIVSIIKQPGVTSTIVLKLQSAGTAMISYTINNTSVGSCPSISSLLVTVAPQATPAAISGASTVCVGSTATYTSASTGGVWSVMGRATINASGVLSTTLAGSTTVKYTLTNANGCSASTSYNVTVNPLPSVPTISFTPGTTGITGSGGYCKNKTFTLIGTPSGGTFNATGTFSITSGGVTTTANTTGAGSVTYSVSNGNGCSNSRTIPANVVSCGPRGVSNQVAVSNEQLVVYPNPAHSTINCKLLTGSGSIVVTDLYGKTIKQQALSMGTNTIDVSSFAKGMYLVSVITEQGKQTQKVVVE